MPVSSTIPGDPGVTRAGARKYAEASEGAKLAHDTLDPEQMDDQQSEAVEALK